MNINNLQLMFDGFSAARKAERAKTQMTLGAIIDRLKQFEPEAMIDGIAFPHSYRGYYSDLAFEKIEYQRTAIALLEDCRSVLGMTLQGYKGGDYDMSQSTPVWIASYGSCGTRIIEITDDGVIVTADEPQD